jgi:drug/metabolite transporter (DMT)-like permease
MEVAGYTYALLTGIFFGLQGILGKNISFKLSPLLGAWANFTFGLPLLLGYLIIQGIPTIDWWNFSWAIILSFSINVFAWYLFFKSFHSAPISHTMPFTAFTPLFLIPVAYVLIGELPGSRGVLGILLIFAGGFTIHLQSYNILSFFKSLRDTSGSRLILLVTFMWSITATAEKVAILSSSPAFYSTVITLLLSLSYLPLVLKNYSRNYYLVRKFWPQLLLVGLIYGLMIIFQFNALKYLLVSYVISFKRAGIIFSVIAGIIIYKEGKAIKNLIATVIMILGVFLIMV